MNKSNSTFFDLLSGAGSAEFMLSDNTCAQWCLLFSILVNFVFWGLFLLGEVHIIIMYLLLAAGQF